MPSKLRIDLGKLSDLIGAIYDCAVDPDGWSDVLRQVCDVMQTNTGALDLIDFAERQPRLYSQWGMPADRADAWQGEFADDVAALHQEIAHRSRHAPFEPQVYSRLFDKAERAAMRVNREWARPLGICDVVSAALSTSPTRLGLLATTRHDSIGPATEREVAVMRLLAPHVRQAVAIADLLDMRRLEADALQHTLDRIDVGIFIVGAHSRILLTNASANQLLETGTPLASTDGCLAADDRQARLALSAAIMHAHQGDVERLADVPAASPILLPGPITAHAYVLPLAAGAIRSRLVPQAFAAVLVTGLATANQDMLDGLATTYDLTAAEHRLISPLSRGLGVAEAAAELGISRNTIKSQQQQIFKKTGVTRHADLVALLARLAPPLTGTGSGGVDNGLSERSKRHPRTRRAPKG